MDHKFAQIHTSLLCIKRNSVTKCQFDFLPCFCLSFPEGCIGCVTEKQSVDLRQFVQSEMGI